MELFSCSDTDMARTTTVVIVSLLVVGIFRNSSADSRKKRDLDILLQPLEWIERLREELEHHNLPLSTVASDGNVPSGVQQSTAGTTARGPEPVQRFNTGQTVRSPASSAGSVEGTGQVEVPSSTATSAHLPPTSGEGTTAPSSTQSPLSNSSSTSASTTGTTAAHRRHHHHHGHRHRG